MEKSNDPTFSGASRFSGIEGGILNAHFFPETGGTVDPATAGTGDGTGTGGNSGGTVDPSQADQGGTQGGQAGGTDDGKGEAKQFTQEQLDAIVAREKGKAARGKIDPKSLGFDTQKELEDFIKSMKEKTDKEKTDAEKKLEEAIEEAKTTAKNEVLSVANERLVRAEFKVAALGYEVKREALDDAYVLAKTLEDWEVEVDDKGVVTGLNKEFFEELKKQKPFLFGEEGSGQRPPDAGAGAGGGGKVQDPTLEDKYPALRKVQ